MRARKPLAFAATVGLGLGLVSVGGTADAGVMPTQDAVVTLTCTGANAETQTLLDLVGGSIPITANVSTAAPEFANNGDVVPVTVEADLQLTVPGGLPIVITGFNVSNLVLNVGVTGGGSAAPNPAAAAPTAFSVVFDPPSAPTLQADTTVTVTDETDPIFFTVLNPVTFSASVVSPDLPPDTIVLALTCVPGNATVAAINGTVPPPTTAPPTPTTAPASTTSTASTGGTTTPRFTG